MAKVLLVGCGDLGGRIAQLLSAAKHEVVGVRLSDKPSVTHMHCIQADVTDVSSLLPLVDVQPDILIYCVAANAQTDKSYQAHYVDGLKHVLATQTNNDHLKHIFFISSTRVYGQVPDALIDESVEAVPADFGGERLLQAEGLLDELACDTTAIRLAGIYGPGRLYLVKMAKDPNRWPAANKWTNRIHRDDAAAFITYLCEKAVANEKLYNCYIGTDNMPALQYDVLNWLAAKLNMPAVPLVQLNDAQKVGGKKLTNKRMKASGYQLKYANYQLGYDEILKREVLKNG